MTHPEDMDAEWKKQRESARLHETASALAAGVPDAESIRAAWNPHTSFESFARAEGLSLERGAAMPMVYTEEITRHKHPSGYGLFAKSSDVPVEELIFSRMAAAVDIPYAVYLPSEDLMHVYTPKLVPDAMSIYDVYLSKLKDGDPELPPVLHRTFHMAVEMFGSPEEIPYREIVGTGDDIKGTDIKEAFNTWNHAFFAKETVFYSKMAALLSVTGTTDSPLNPTNMIVNPANGAFLYAIDQGPVSRRRAVINTPWDDGVLRDPFYRTRVPVERSLVDQDAFSSMQGIIQDKITDTFLSAVIGDVKDMVGASPAMRNDREGRDAFDKSMDAYGEALKRGRDTKLILG